MACISPVSPAEAASRSCASRTDGSEANLTQPLRLLVPDLGQLAQLRRILAVQREQLVEAQPEHAPVEPEAPVERQHRATQHRHFAERMMLGILLQRLEATRDVDDLGLRLGERRRVSGRLGRPACTRPAIMRLSVLRSSA